MPSASKRRAAERAARKRQLRTIGAAVAVVIVLGGVAVLSTSLGGDDAVDGGSQTQPVEVEGVALPVFPEQGEDPAVGTVAPTLVGRDFGGDRVEVGPGGSDGVAQAIWFVAHWCPHCQAEVPVIVELARTGSIPEGMSVLTVSTSVDAAAPNYPPSAWLEREGWPYPVLADDERGTAAHAYGVAGFPFLVVLDADGTVLARTSGELGADGIVTLLERAVTTAR